jgi:hypothetical protein
MNSFTYAIQPKVARMGNSLPAELPQDEQRRTDLSMARVSIVPESHTCILAHAPSCPDATITEPDDFCSTTSEGKRVL